MKKYIVQAVRYRWGVAAVLFAVCVALHLHGSSIGMFNQYFPTQTDVSIAEQYSIWGSARAIRSDEWAVHTPTYFSQAYNHHALYSDHMGVNGANMVLDYFAPSWDVTALAKPLNWGYLLFGNEAGLSWYWCGQMLLLFLSAFELFWILTRKNVCLSLLGMIMVGLSPAMQWWMVPHIPIVFIYGMCLFVLGYCFFTETSRWKTVLLSLLSVIALSGFALSLFPSIQVPVGLVTLLLLIACLWRDCARFAFPKWKWFFVIFIFLGTAGIVGGFLLRSLPDLQALMNTVYPGERRVLGGDCSVYAAFTDLYSMFLPYKDSNRLNNCEVATFIHFAPICAVLFFRPRKWREVTPRNRLTGYVLAGIAAVQLWFMLLGFPHFLAKITLFTYVNRMHLAYGWTATLFTIWVIDSLWTNNIRFSKWEQLLYPLCFGLAYVLLLNQEMLAYLTLKYALLEILAFMVLTWLFITHRKRLFALGMVAIMVFAGFPVNPLSRGISPITNHPISHLIQEIRAQDPEAKWLAVGENTWGVANFAMANGAEVINGTSFYPVGDWDALDPDGQYEQVHNRYSNESVVLTDESTYFSTPFPDQVYLHLNPKDLQKLDVSYVIATHNLSQDWNKYHIPAEVLLVQDQYIVYQIGDLPADAPTIR